MSAPNVKDLATSLVVAAPSPALSGTGLQVTNTQGGRFPTVPFDAIAHPADELPTVDNAERVLVTARTSDTMTIVRGQGITSAKSIAVGWRISAANFSEHITNAYDRSNHTGSQAIGTITNLQTLLDTMVVGPASSTDNAVPRFDGTTGKLLQNSGLTIADNGFVLASGSIETPGALIADTLSEHTANAGITADGVLLKDSSIYIDYLGGKSDPNVVFDVNGNFLGTLSVGGSLVLLTSQKGVAGGLAELDGSGLVPSSQLPSFVDDVIEAANFGALPGTGSTGKIYVTLDNNLTYRWSGSAYVEISASLALGETSSTAYRGDRGKTAYDHSQITTGNPHGTSKADVGLGNVPNTDATLRSNHTGTQAISTVSGLQTALDGKEAALIPTAVKTSNYTAAPSDFVPLDTTSNAITLTLPTAPADGTVIGMKIVTFVVGNNVTIATGGSDVFNKAGGVTSVTIQQLNQGVTLQYKASTGIWYVVSDNLGLSQLDARYQYVQVTQASHGFAVGNVLRYNGTSFVKAQANSSANAEVVGMVSSVINANTFVIVAVGYVSGLSGLTAGTTYFLSPSTAGALTATAPTTAGQVNKPLFNAISTTAGFFANFRGTAVTDPTPYVLTDAATIAVDASLANKTGFRVTLGGNRTLGNPSNAYDGQLILFEINQDGTGGRTLALDTKYVFGTDITSITLTTGASKTDLLGVRYKASVDKFEVVLFIKGY